MTDIQIPKTHKAAVYDAPGTISTKIEMVETPTPGPGEVLVNLTHSGVCHSDIGVIMSNWVSLPFPTQQGQIGATRAAATSPVKAGDRVGIKWISATCTSCPAWLTGHDGVCFHQKISGYYAPGTFQHLGSAEASPMLCAGITTYAALRRSGALSGEWVVVLGAGGGLGNIAVQLSSRGMNHRVIGIDHASKEDLVIESGAEHFVPLLQDAKDAPSVTDSYVTCFRTPTFTVKRWGFLRLGWSRVAGPSISTPTIASPRREMSAANAAYASSVSLLRFGGRVVCVGIPEGEALPITSVAPQVLIAKALSIVGVAVGNRKEAGEVLEFAARGIVKTHYRVEKMEALTSVFEEMNAGTLRGRVV
ncbi:GroES-like protein [Mytilinidion resinicola]|uniref:GroES-like protein n=1 Tax=Mytilinidion resinicola TaxID=574789 RepID=A0A6A6Y5Q8_9PEZI|nr:GroES-like protein [Mytilinidion resinicola]KAF2803959.1 GroES-like protein [Mytilinidion resinicola]